MAELRIFRGKKTDFDSNNPYIQENELYIESFFVDGVETESTKAKLGPGRWNDLGYYVDPNVQSPDWGDLGGTLADQTDLQAALDAKADSSSVTAAIAAALTTAGKRRRVRAATTANITISTALNNGDTLDGVTLATGDLVLVKDQSAPEQNGVYVVGATPARDGEFDTYNEHPGSIITVEEGTVNADKVFMCTSNDGGTLNTTAITFTFILSLKTKYESFIIPCSDRSTPIVAATNVMSFRMPYPFHVTEVRASLDTVQASGSIFTVDINEAGTSIISTKLTIDNTEGTSQSAATPAVISDADIADDAVVSVDVDQVGNGTAKGLVVTIIGYRTD